MTRLLFDTTFLIDTERSGEDLEDVIDDDDDDVAIAAITVAELRVGALLAAPKHKAARTAYLEDIVATIPVVDYDVKVAEAHAELLVAVRTQGKPRGAHDLIIAASARASDRMAVSAGTSAFSEVPGVTARSHR